MNSKQRLAADFVHLKPGTKGFVQRVITSIVQSNLRDESTDDPWCNILDTFVTYGLRTDANITFAETVEKSEASRAPKSRKSRKSTPVADALDALVTDVCKSVRS